METYCCRRPFESVSSGDGLQISPWGGVSLLISSNLDYWVLKYEIR
ncbi:hypothetical protein HanXRQr2_Chr13g0580531 [Helianthus annuus]|uniref:Uncharacterized protein n=1 Tax=Helianthus annuus TaxID=4232 RepID=A0A9K3HAA1_HELAN|nr:hypothetical protein HanXRQr2_Chr13g0580531 [Helianthus annuus]KAJ0848542.1 hypothetical protein HanPSC8_Chr13g0558721 [Helianthus annuus]